MTHPRSRVVKSTTLDPETVQTSGMVRNEAIHTDLMWAGTAQTAGGVSSGWHHHGEHESTIYVVRGLVRLESGPGGRTVQDAGPGDFLWVPAGEVHREGNPDPSPSTIVVVRAGRGEIVVNVDGPEPE